MEIENLQVILKKVEHGEHYFIVPSLKSRRYRRLVHLAGYIHSRPNTSFAVIVHFGEDSKFYSAKSIGLTRKQHRRQGFWWIEQAVQEKEVAITTTTTWPAINSTAMPHPFVMGMHRNCVLVSLLSIRFSKFE